MIQAGLDWALGVGLVAGVDEVGRGPLLGDVVVAAVILDPKRPIIGLQDSKKLSEKRRTALALEIHEKALAVCIARASVAEIDAMNILQATLLAMRRAVEGLALQPVFCQIDGNRVPPGLPCPAEAVVKGDGKIAAIAAASIVAKVQRDSEMHALHRRHQEYGFDRHKGYGTKQHLAALLTFGVLAEHRRSFAPVKACIANQ